MTAASRSLATAPWRAPRRLAPLLHHHLDTTAHPVSFESIARGHLPRQCLLEENCPRVRVLYEGAQRPAAYANSSERGTPPLCPGGSSSLTFPAVNQ